MENKITVVGSGYVGLSNAVCLAQMNEVTVLDIDSNRVDMINDRKAPIVDNELDFLLSKPYLNINATLNKTEAYQNAEYIFIATPTDYCCKTNYFDTESIQSVIKDVIKINPDAIIVIKSTIPVGFVLEMRAKYHFKNIIFSPEFLREGSAVADIQRPSRIVVGDKTKIGEDIGMLMYECSMDSDVNILYTDPIEAEAIKLFANSYLAMRVAYFNELDTYAEVNDLNSKDIIKGISLDPRIGNFYNNPSFGYGGYCFPKDTKQLLANYKENRIPNRLVGSVVYSNEVRKDWIANQILRKNPNVVGIYRMAMKSGSDNYRSSAMQGIIERLRTQVKVVIYEPMCREDEFLDCVLETELNKFKKLSDVIVANRLEDNITDVKEKVYTRDIYGNN